MTEPNRKLAGGGRQRQNSGCLGPFADLFLGSVLVEASVGANIGPSHAQQSPAEADTHCGSFCSSKQLSGLAISSIWHWSASESLPKGPRRDKSSGELQTTSEQDQISFINGISKERSQQTQDTAEVNSTPCGSTCTAACALWLVSAFSQWARGLIPHVNRLIAIKTQLQ